MDLNSINVIILAYLGDSVYELYIREKLIDSGIANVNDLQTKATNYVSAKAQANILNSLINDNFLTEEEIDIVKRGRNYKRNYHPKNTDIVTYKKSTGFETLIGYLYLNDKDRLNILLKEIEVK